VTNEGREEEYRDRKKPNWTILHNKFLQLRESDLLGLELIRDVASPSSHSSFCEEVFSLRIRETNEVDRTNILAPGL
jgi:hypothetical protein